MARKLFRKLYYPNYDIKSLNLFDISAFYSPPIFMIL